MRARCGRSLSREHRRKVDDAPGQGIVPKRAVVFKDLTGNVETGLYPMLIQHRQGIDVVVELAIVEGDGKNGPGLGVALRPGTQGTGQRQTSKVAGGEIQVGIEFLRRHSQTGQWVNRPLLRREHPMKSDDRQAPTQARKRCGHPCQSQRLPTRIADPRLERSLCTHCPITLSFFFPHYGSAFEPVCCGPCKAQKSA